MFGIKDIMKPLRIISVLFGGLALAPLLLIGAVLALSPFQNAEFSRVEELQACLGSQLQAYRDVKGHYPDSLQALTFTNLPQAIRVQPNLRSTTYRRAGSGYELSYKGWWYHSTLSVSNNGASSASRITAR